MQTDKFPNILALLLVLCMVVLAPGCQPDQSGGNGHREIKNSDYFIIATTSDVATLDPAYAYDIASAGQIQNIFESLLKFAEGSTSQFVPALATEWQVSDDGLAYRFKIRQNVNFHNGNPLTPEDVEYSFERGMVHDYSQGPQWMFFEPLFGLGTYSSRTQDGLIPLDAIQSKIEVDGQWVQFNLAIPYEPFLQILASSWGSVVDMDWCIQNGDWNGTEESYQKLNNQPPGGSPIHSLPNGTGPYKIDYWDPATEISLLRNPDYWGETPAFERVITKVVDEWSLRKLMLELGDVDCAIVPPASINELQNMEGITSYESVPTLTNQALFFQFDISPTSTMAGSGRLDGKGIPADFFSDINIRKGFACAFDWQTYIEEAMAGYGQQIACPIVEGAPYFSSNWPHYELDLTRAEEFLKQAWDGQVWENGFEVTVVYAAGDETGKIACEILQNNLFTINPLFKINIQIMNWPNILDNMVLGNLPMFLNGWTADYPDPHNFVFPYMHSMGTFTQWQRFHNTEADTLIEQALAAQNIQERQELYDQIAQLYYEEVPSIMLSQTLSIFFFQDWIQGFVYNPIRPVYEMYAPYLSKGY